MKCPHCKKRLTVPNYVYYNVENFRKPATSVSECCGKPVTVSISLKWGVEKYNGPATEDDWGVEIKGE